MIAGELKVLTPRNGWRTSEGQMTAAAGALLAAGKAAEAFGWIPPGSTEGFAPLAALVGAYVLSRTGLKIMQERRTLQTGEVPK
jgi:hypothetical protein